MPSPVAASAPGGQDGLPIALLESPDYRNRFSNPIFSTDPCSQIGGTFAHGLIGHRLLNRVSEPIGCEFPAGDGRGTCAQLGGVLAPDGIRHTRHLKAAPAGEYNGSLSGPFECVQDRPPSLLGVATAHTAESHVDGWGASLKKGQ